MTNLRNFATAPQNWTKYSESFANLQESREVLWSGCCFLILKHIYVTLSRCWHIMTPAPRQLAPMILIRRKQGTTWALPDLTCAGHIGRSHCTSVTCDGHIGRSHCTSVTCERHIGWFHCTSVTRDGHVGRSHCTSVTCDGHTGRYHCTSVTSNWHTSRASLICQNIIRQILAG